MTLSQNSCRGWIVATFNVMIGKSIWCLIYSGIDMSDCHTFTKIIVNIITETRFWTVPSIERTSFEKLIDIRAMLVARCIGGYYWISSLGYYWHFFESCWNLKLGGQDF